MSTPRRAACLALRTAPTLVVVAAYAVAAWALFAPLGLLDASHIPAEVASGCGCSDDGQQVWMLAVARANLAAGHLPFFTTVINYPVGVNLTQSADFPLLASLMAPVTAMAGPVASFDLLVRISLVASAVSGYGVLRRLELRAVAAGLGGGLYGFSPFLVRQTESHVFLAFAPIPPIILLIIFRRLRGDVGRPLRGGLEVGALAVVQALISVEVLAMTAVVALTVIVVLGLVRVVRRRPIRAALVVLGRLGAGAAVVAMPALAYPTWYFLAGPQHIVGPPSPVGTFALSPLATIFPNATSVVAGLWSGWSVGSQGFVSTMGFVGIPLLTIAAWVTLRRRQNDVVVVPAVLLGLVAWIFALGERVRIGHAGAALLLPLPFGALAQIPLIESVVPNRFTLFMSLALAVLVAVAADRLLARAADRHLPSALLGGAVLLAGVALVLPSTTVPVAGVAGAQVFASTPGKGVVAPGAVVIAYPYPRFTAVQAMLWQAEDGMRFELIGGYAERPIEPDEATDTPGRAVGDGTKDPAPLPPAISRLLLHPGPVGTRSLRQAEAGLPAFVTEYRITTAMVQGSASGAAPVISAFGRVFGPPTRIGSVLVWSHLRTAAPARA